jgi:hypothetical protein
MSEAGQGTVTGISKQADVTLLYLLNNYRSGLFQTCIMEGIDWEDFTLVFSDRTESYEVKWHASLPLSTIKEIVQKELAKEAQGYRFKIVCKVLGKNTREDVCKIKNASVVLENNELWNEYRANFDKFINNGWSRESLLFLANVEMIEVGGDEQLERKIYDYFLFEDVFYMDNADINSVISESFRNILKKSETGQSIKKSEFVDALNGFKMRLAEKSESFPPSIKIGEKIENMQRFLSSIGEFKKINNSKYLTPISFNLRVIQFTIDRLADNDFPLKEICFFLEKVLAKHFYYFACMKIFDSKFKNNLFDIDAFLQFISGNYNRLSEDSAIHQVFKLLYMYSEQNDTKDVYEKIFIFFKRCVLSRMKEISFADRYNPNNSFRYEYFAKLLNKIGVIMEGDEEYLKLLFNHFDFTSNLFNLNASNNMPYYHWVKNYLAQDIVNRLDRVKDQVICQFKNIYGKKYKGYESSGGLWEMSGSEFIIKDLDLVEHIFAPAFTEAVNNKNKNEIWEFIKKNIFVNGKTAVNANHPVFLSRSIVGILVAISLDKNVDSTMRNESYDQLKKVLKITKGLPSTTEIVFNSIRGVNPEIIAQNGILSIIDLVDIALGKYNEKSSPDSVIMLEVLFLFLGSDPENILNKLEIIFTNEKFHKTMVFPSLMSILADKKYIPGDEKLLVRLIEVMNLEKLIDKNELSDGAIVFISNAFESVLLRSRSTAELILSRYVSAATSNIQRINFFGGIVMRLAEKYPNEIYDLLKTIIEDSDVYKNLLKDSFRFKHGILCLSVGLASSKLYDQARFILDVLFDDKNFMSEAYYLSMDKNMGIKSGKEAYAGVFEDAIRLLERFAGSKNADLIMYALERTLFLMDLMSDLSKSLGYSEANYALRIESVHVLALIARLETRAVLKEANLDQDEQIKMLAMQFAAWINSLLKSGDSPRAAGFAMLALTQYIVKDLNTKEANIVLDIFESFDIKESSGLFIYYAFYRKGYNLDIPFDMDEFKIRLNRLSKRTCDIRIGMAHELCNMVDRNEFDDTITADIARDIWKQFLYGYQKTVYSYLYSILVNELSKIDRCVEAKRVLFSALSNEAEYLEKSPNVWPDLNIREIGAVLFDNDMLGFLSFMSAILSYSDVNTGRILFGFELSSLVTMFQQITQVELNADEKSLYLTIIEKCSDLSIELKLE